MIIVVALGRWAVQMWDAGKSLVRYFLTPAGGLIFGVTAPGLRFRSDTHGITR
jgi:hypothetical protein